MVDLAVAEFQVQFAGGRVLGIYFQLHGVHALIAQVLHTGYDDGGSQSVAAVVWVNARHGYEAYLAVPVLVAQRPVVAGRGIVVHDEDDAFRVGVLDADAGGYLFYGVWTEAPMLSEGGVLEVGQHRLVFAELERLQSEVVAQGEGRKLSALPPHLPVVLDLPEAARFEHMARVGGVGGRLDVQNVNVERGHLFERGVQESAADTSSSAPARYAALDDGAPDGDFGE